MVPDEAMRALRANKTGGFAFHTDIEDEPWWRIDLGEQRRFDEIRCYNRLGTCSERANDLIVELSDDNVAWQVVHRQNGLFGGADGDPLRVVIPRMSARYLRLRIPSHTALHLDAVEVYDWTAAA